MRALSGLLSLLLLIAGVHAHAADETSCTACHAEVDDVVQAFQSDVHASVGLSCHDCHGGNPSPELAGDAALAMDAEFPGNGYLGAPSREAMPGFCGRCHSDPAYMKRFKPDARVDQVSEYWTSQHGALLREGDELVATCVDCHGVHGIRRPSDPESSVHPTQVALTCRTCHSDAERMAGYTLDDGTPIPIDQYELWRRSVHAAALLDREDLSAPTCNDCHGNHGARPPGLDSVSFVCGQCHGREATLFRQSGKKHGFEAHNDLLEGADTCADCHSSEVITAVSGVRHFTECETCHGNHAVIRPTVALLGPLPETPCDFCHASPAPSEGEEVEQREVLANFERERALLLDEARELGLSGDALFDWFLDRALTLPQHKQRGSADSSAPRPHFLRLWEKFRIGQTHFVYRDPVTGEAAKKPLTRCTTCHGPESDLAATATGYATSKAFLERMQQLTVLIAEAERTLLAAQRGGVEVREVQDKLDAAENAEIQLIALVHTFSVEDDGEFAKTHEEGVAQARDAWAKGREGLGEMWYRRGGLAVSLVIIVFVLVGLGLKIRQLARQRDEEAGS